jgi:hypothetical protein
VYRTAKRIFEGDLYWTDIRTGVEENISVPVGDHQRYSQGMTFVEELRLAQRKNLPLRMAGINSAKYTVGVQKHAVGDERVSEETMEMGISKNGKAIAEERNIQYPLWQWEKIGSRLLQRIRETSTPCASNEDWLDGMAKTQIVWKSRIKRLLKLLRGIDIK